LSRRANASGMGDPNPCLPLSIWHPNREAPFELMLPSHQCTNAYNLITFFAFFIAFNSIHLGHSLYRVYLFRKSGHTWKQLIRYHGCLVELLADVVSILGNGFYLGGLNYVGYAVQAFCASLLQLAALTNAFHTITLLLEPFADSEAAAQLNYARSIKRLTMLAVLENCISLTASYFFYTRDRRSFAVSACTCYAVLLLVGLFLTKTLYQAAGECQRLLSRDVSTEASQGLVMTGFNASLFNGKGQVHGEVQSRRKLIADACKKLETDVKFRALSWIVINSMTVIPEIIATAVLWNTHDGLSYAQYAANGMFGVATLASQAVRFLPSTKLPDSKILNTNEVTVVKVNSYVSNTRIASSARDS